MNRSNALPTLTSLRRLLPRREITYDEAIIIAEQQANRLAAAWGNRPIQESDIINLTRLDIVRADFGSRSKRGSALHSGASRYHNGRWMIWLDASEVEARQRFTICHELKHILDWPYQSSYKNLSQREIERICDHFAGCLLMSKVSIYRLWGDGLQTPEALAAVCRVSLAAMKVRLRILHLPINNGASGSYFCRTNYREHIYKPPTLKQMGVAA
ncbi:ImmA/IrrE family metallo-endopeptidase [Nocardia blacklockiae]|uniref:ImmA/IrrE family metallo-endopeptidase n=1 Tax=Nocardia blacklockiae TaxID=480036 RepID=UPI001895A633|nr:ImmA/IrrE family metallo-endopeptidase [Nocardia blacklockiae]MBF6171283.1 ImmA/IrrE family metallo-endopeptidase [Nocardia blacklockiae]